MVRSGRVSVSAVRLYDFIRTRTATYEVPLLVLSHSIRVIGAIPFGARGSDIHRGLASLLLSPVQVYTSRMCMCLQQGPERR